MTTVAPNYAAFIGWPAIVARWKSFGRAIEAVGPQKQRRLAKAALLFLAQNRSQRPCRFDVLGLDRGRDGAWSFTLVKNAFDAPVLSP